MNLEESKNQLLEYFNYSVEFKNPLTDNIHKDLESIKDDILNSNLDESIKRKYVETIGISGGGIIYNTKDLTNILGISRTNLKLIINSLEKEGKLNIVKAHGVTFLYVSNNNN